jgi:hypothetical protein
MTAPLQAGLGGRVPPPPAKRWLISSLLLIAFAQPAISANEPLLLNGEFVEWGDGIPAGWEISTGATSGGMRASHVGPIDESGLELSGDRETGVWKSVFQSVAVIPGATYRLTFEAQAKGVRREDRQFGNCYVGALIFDTGGQRKGIEFRSIFEAALVPGQLLFTTPEGAARADVMIFLSQTGTLRVRRVGLEQVAPEESFSLLVDEVERYYSFLQLKEIDWRKEAESIRPAAEAAKAPREFVAAVRPLLEKLRDLHVTMHLPDGEQVGTFRSRGTANFDARTIAERLKSTQQIGRMGFVGRTAEGYGYVALGSLTADRETAARFLQAVDGLLDAPGLIFDLRVNGGGAEPLAQEIVSRFTRSPVLYAKNQVRCGPEPDDLMAISERILQPHPKVHYGKPLAVLIGPKCISSGEGMALMLAALPQAKLSGQPTQGASGNPRPVRLPNGVIVLYSTWIALTPEGEPIEGQGVQPDVEVPDDPTGEAGLSAAIEHLTTAINN